MPCALLKLCAAACESVQLLSSQCWGLHAPTWLACMSMHSARLSMDLIRAMHCLCSDVYLSIMPHPTPTGPCGARQPVE